MAFWSRLRRKDLQFLSTQLKRCYLQTHSPIAASYLTSSTGNPMINNSNSIINNIPLQFTTNVRFFAAPVQAKEKEEKDSSGPRLNEEIMAQFIRLVTDQGHNVVSRHEALRHAKSQKMDLVEVDRNAKPPVCKIMDYNKEKYQQQVKEKERSKSKCELKKGACKEVRFAAKIKQRDLQMKADTAKRLMESGYRVKCAAVEPTDETDLESLLSRFSALIEDVAIVESEPRIEKKQAFVVVRHSKFGPSKKGSGTKASKTTESTIDTADVTLQSKGTDDDTSPEELSDADIDSNISGSSIFNGQDDLNKVFDIPTSIDSERQHTAVPKPGIQNRYARDPRNRDRSTRFPNPQTQQNPMNDDHRQDSYSTAKSYGIFGGQQVGGTRGEENNTPAQVNRYAKRNPSDPRSGRGPDVFDRRSQMGSQSR